MSGKKRTNFGIAQSFISNINKIYDEENRHRIPFESVEAEFYRLADNLKNRLLVLLKSPDQQDQFKIKSILTKLLLFMDSGEFNKINEINMELEKLNVSKVSTSMPVLTSRVKKNIVTVILVTAIIAGGGIISEFVKYFEGGVSDNQSTLWAIISVPLIVLVLHKRTGTK